MTVQIRKYNTLAIVERHKGAVMALGEGFGKIMLNQGIFAFVLLALVPGSEQFDTSAYDG